MRIKLYLIGTLVIVGFFVSAHLVYLRLHKTLEAANTEISNIQQVLSVRDIQIQSLQNQLETLERVERQDRERAARAREDLARLKAETDAKIANAIKALDIANRPPAEVEVEVTATTSQIFRSINEASRLLLQEEVK